jgi:hypothetical protein
MPKIYMSRAKARWQKEGKGRWHKKGGENLNISMRG